jgi:hypothetical protein
MAPAASPTAATREGSFSMAFHDLLLDEVHEVENEGGVVRRGVTSCSGWFGQNPSGNQSSLVGPERASCRLLQIIVDNSAEAERKIGADVNC